MLRQHTTFKHRTRCKFGLACSRLKNGTCRFLHDKYDTYVCNVCKQPGHTSISCLRATCKLCGQVGHVQSFCSKAICTVCNGIGHTKTVCNALKCKTQAVQHAKHTSLSKSITKDRRLQSDRKQFVSEKADLYPLCKFCNTTSHPPNLCTAIHNVHKWMYANSMS